MIPKYRDLFRSVYLNECSNFVKNGIIKKVLLFYQHYNYQTSEND